MIFHLVMLGVVEEHRWRMVKEIHLLELRYWWIYKNVIPAASATISLISQYASENTGSGGGGGLWANNGVSRPSGGGGSGLFSSHIPPDK